MPHQALEHVRIPIHVPPCRHLLGLLASRNDESLQSSQSIAVYFHGFPDLSVHPDISAPPVIVSRFPRKLQEQLPMDLLCVNFSGLPGSDSQVEYRRKLLSQELDDAKGIVAYCSDILQKQHIHIVGLSTGSILAAGLRNYEHDGLRSISVVAGILDTKTGLHLDFSPPQLENCRSRGFCETPFYWPTDWPLSDDARKDSDYDKTGKVWRPLDKNYIEDMLLLDIPLCVTTGTVPLFVIHGDQDKNVPIEYGRDLFDAASEPKRWLSIKGANHLLSNAKHMKKAIHAIHAHIKEAESGQRTI
jgi:pimeloyl-ACP methyl ester carboxylesterase